MTEDEKRQQKAMLLLQHEETRQELEHLRSKAWTISEEISEIAHWLAAAREMPASGGVDYRQRERDEKISKSQVHYREVFNFDLILSLRDELRTMNARYRELGSQKKALGLGE
jgi:hypothetical protein